MQDKRQCGYAKRRRAAGVRKRRKPGRFYALLALLFFTGCSTTAPPDYFTGWRGIGVNNIEKPEVFTQENIREGATVE